MEDIIENKSAALKEDEVTGEQSDFSSATSFSSSAGDFSQIENTSTRVVLYIHNKDSLRNLQNKTISRR